MKSETVITKEIKYDWNLEGFRGGLAIIVGLAHVFGITNLLDPNYHPNLYWLNVGHITVLVFFVMSGYVIGLTNKEKKPFSRKNAIQYLIKRSVRLFPIYIIALSIGILARPNFYFHELLGNLLFLQNIVVSRIDGNSPVWSLGYEVFYYLIFLIIWWLRIPLSTLLFFSLTIGILGAANSLVPEWIYGYYCGLFFWLAGLYIAWRSNHNEAEIIKATILSYFSFFSIRTSNATKNKRMV